MPDWCHLTPRLGSVPSRCDPRLDPRLHRLRRLLAELVACRDGLSELAMELPLPTTGFDRLAEARAAIECVHCDLLDDAVDTLQHVLTADDFTLRRESVARANLSMD